MRSGFVIDHRRCIGCHACTVACKEENQVPLGAFRTWVKYIERGEFPHVRRYFSVLRCNHCDDAPCVTICPTVALYRRPDGIVDFDGDRCIGCKSCMQACPYDALYIDPNTQTAAKCNYCAHRVEVGLEPACVIVCPVQAIIAGDLDNPESRIARIVATEQVQVRKAEQGTKPKVFYVGADTANLTPSLQAPTQQYLWAQRPAEEVSLAKMLAASSGDGRAEPGLSRPVYDVPHMPRPWGWKVSTYLWTKSVAAGALLLAAFGPWGRPLDVGAPLISLIFLALTTLLLIVDLKRPDRFHYILFKPNWRSWLVWGGWILIAFGAVAGLWLLGVLAGRLDLLRVLILPAVLLALAAAGYSAFLFGQAEGRDFWQSPLTLPHLIVAALVAGGAALLVIAADWRISLPETPGVIFKRAPFELVPAHTLGPLLVFSLIAHGLLVLIELFSRHPNHDAAAAARLLTRGPFRGWLWGGVLLGGIVAPMIATLAAAAWSSAPLTVLGALLALAGLWLWEDLWVRAGQAIPLS